jgi:hypothetical protein
LNIEAIATSLSRICRFNGHCAKFMSVAQHCVIVSQLVPEHLALQGLMHDASEAFIGDIPRPLKALLDQFAPDVVRKLEDSIHEALADRHGFDFPFAPEIKWADNVSLATEQRDLMGVGPAWPGLPEPMVETLVPWGQSEARSMFLHRFNNLTYDSWMKEITTNGPYPVNP